MACILMRKLAPSPGLSVRLWNGIRQFVGVNSFVCNTCIATRQRNSSSKSVGLSETESLQKPMKVNSNEVEFTGSIPIDELQFTFSRSSGPGGQNVNKVNSKVEIRFHVPSAKWISDTVKTKLLEREAGRITKDGYLVVASDKTRKQLLNQADCVGRLRTMLFAAANDKPYELTPEELELLQKRQAKAKAAVLREKKAMPQSNDLDSYQTLTLFKNSAALLVGFVRLTCGVLFYFSCAQWTYLIYFSHCFQCLSILFFYGIFHKSVILSRLYIVTACTSGLTKSS